VQNASLISKVFFPRILLPLSTLFSALCDVSVALVLVLGGSWLMGLKFSVNVLFVPVWLAGLAFLSVGGGLIAGGLMVRYRDVQYIVPVLTQLLFYASPVAYPVSAVPEGARPYYLLNPLASLIEGLRWSLLGTALPAGPDLLYAGAVSCLVLVAGSMVFRRLERGFADVI
jgi:lipopolysaccharide transport system permease protein